jgi:Ca2+-binding EF-hand superfamily protein
VKKRGAEGLQGLARNFKICDTNGSGKLDVEELAKCCKLCKLNLSPDELQTIFNFFDQDRSGLVSFEEFIRTVRGKMNPPRTKLVEKIFRTLDEQGDGSGTLTAADIAPAYNAADHPDVISGDKTEEQVLRDFLNAFEGQGGNQDGEITLEEWTGYYESISAGIDDVSVQPAGREGGG